jgi:DNA repair protein RecO (recombination protein O)
MSQERVGIVVGRTDLGESDRIVRLLTAEEGRVDLVARGARRSRKRFPGALEPGTRLRIRRRRGRGDLDTLVGADVLSSPRRAREEYDRLLLLGYGCEVLSGLSEQGLASDKGYKLLEVWLACLEADPSPDHASRVALEAKALTFAGLAPALRSCPACGEALDGEVSFDLDAGGGVHPWCGTGEAMDASVLEAIEVLRRTPLRETAGYPLPRTAWWLMARFIEYQTRRELRSRALLETMEDV